MSVFEIVLVDVFTAVFLIQAVKNIEDEQLFERILFGLMAALWPILLTAGAIANAEIPYLDIAKKLWIPGFLLLILTIKIGNKHRLNALEKKDPESSQEKD